MVCIVAWFVYFPSANAGNEMKTVALIEGTSETAKWLILCSAAGVIPLYLIYVKLRFRTPAFLLFNEDNIVLQTKKQEKIIPCARILRVIFKEPNLYSQLWDHKLIVSIQLYDFETLQLHAKHYCHSEDIVDSFLSYDALGNRIKESSGALSEIDID
jgi:hypothetical protein